mmetsp:Transcript_30359/g.30858  ORF Transcript_30359/g.30858 Transcript_30359/m.30858 type:complete len:207 (-) Transcript_30359:47-667(-)
METVLRVAGPIFFISMQASSINTAASIFEGKTVGNLSALPFLSLLINCIVWSIYGFLKSDFTVLIPNGSGLLAGAGCTYVYHQYCTSSPRRLYTAGMVVVLASLYFACSNDAPSVGYIGCGLSVLVMGSPLATLRNVISERSTISMPFSLSLSAWMNALSWLMYGLIVANDPIIYLPNLLGFLLTSLQMSLFIVYGLPPHKPSLPF